MQPYEAQVRDFVDEIWASMVRLSVRPDDRATARAEGEEPLIGRVRITGAWRGSVELECDPELARAAAASMFGLAGSEASDEQVADALGELTNMTGGSFKSLLPEPCFLSLPVVGGRGAAGADRGRPIRFGFRALDRPFRVNVVEEIGIERPPAAT